MLANLITRFVSPMLKSWRSTLLGVGTLASGVAILAGVGVSAADGELTTEQAVLGWGMVSSGIAQIVGKDASAK